MNNVNKNKKCNSLNCNGKGGIFDYYTDASMHININKCNDFSPLRLLKVNFNKNIDVENELKGMTRCNSSCLTEKYKPTDLNLIERVDKTLQKDDTRDCFNRL